MADIDQDKFNELLEAAKSEGYSEKELRDVLASRGHRIVQPTVETLATAPAQIDENQFLLDKLGQGVQRASGPLSNVFGAVRGAGKIAGIGGKEAKKQIQERVVNPLFQAGYEDTAGAIGTVSELSLPEDELSGIAFLASMGTGNTGTKPLTDFLAKKFPKTLGRDVAKTAAYLTPGGRIPFEEAADKERLLTKLGQTYQHLRASIFPRDETALKIIDAKGYGLGATDVGNAVKAGATKNLNTSRSYVKSAYEDVAAVGRGIPHKEPSSLLGSHDVAKEMLGPYAKSPGDPAVSSALDELERVLYTTKGKKRLAKKLSPEALIKLDQKLGAHVRERASRSVTGELNPRGKAFAMLQDAVKADIEALGSKELGNALDIARSMAKEHFDVYGNDVVQDILSKDSADALNQIFASPTTSETTRTAVGQRVWDFAANKQADNIHADMMRSSNPEEFFRSLTQKMGGAPDAIRTLGRDRYLTLQRLSQLESAVRAAQKEFAETSARLAPTRRTKDVAGQELIKQRSSDASILDKLKSRAGQALAGGSIFALGWWTGHPLIGLVAAAGGLAPEAVARMYLSSKGQKFRAAFGKAALAIGEPSSKVAMRNLINFLPKEDRPKKNMSQIMPTKANSKEPMVEMVNSETEEVKMMPKSQADREDANPDSMWQKASGM